MAPIPKPLASERKLAKHDSRAKLKRDEDAAKKEVRQRDGFKCRFPLCGCRRLGWRLEASHAQHKGAGGNPSGSRSTSAGMILLCFARHREGVISRHKGTMRIRALGRGTGMNGPVAFDIDLNALPDSLDYSRPKWVEVARENKVQQLDRLNETQRTILEMLAEMKL